MNKQLIKLLVVGLCFSFVGGSMEAFWPFDSDAEVKTEVKVPKVETKVKKGGMLSNTASSVWSSVSAHKWSYILGAIAITTLAAGTLEYCCGTFSGLLGLDKQDDQDEETEDATTDVKTV